MVGLDTQQFTGVDEICTAGEADVSGTVQHLDGTWRRAGGVYRDRYRRTPDGWRIARRDAEHMVDLPPEVVE